MNNKKTRKRKNLYRNIEFKLDIEDPSLEK